jgi:tetratricopeptide (TPR) repeat protein
LKKLSLLILFILSSSLLALKAQDRHIIDSLQSELNKFEAYKKELGRNASPLMDSNKANLLYAIAFEYLDNPHDTGIYYAQQVLALSEQIRYEKGVGNAYNAMGLINAGMKNYSVALDYYKKALKIRTDIDDKKGTGGTYNNLGLLYGNMGEINESIKWHFKSLKLKEEIGDREGMVASYGKIGHDYTNLGKFPEAINNYLYALEIEEEDSNKIEIGGAYRDIGDVYYSVGNYPEASKNYLNELKIANKSGDEMQIAYADINMGRICYKQGNYSDAIKYMLATLKINEERLNIEHLADIHYYLGLVYLAASDYSVALSNADTSLKESQLIGSQLFIARADIEIASIYEKNAKLTEALNAASKGLSLAENLGARVEMQDAYICTASINAAMNNYKAAYQADNEYINNLDSISSNESVKKIAVLEMNYAFDKKEDSIYLEQEKMNIIKTAESKRKSIITGSAIVISILTILMAILLINRQQLKHRKDTIIFEKETNLLLLEKQRIEDELVKAKVTLDDYIMNMVEKNELLEQFKVDFENLKNLKAKEIDENRIEHIEHLNKTTILTEEDWNKFKELFERVNKGFLIRLKEKLPELTQAEIRLLCLTKLELGTKQMAGILGVSFDTIKKSRHRLRKKLGLLEDNSIDNVVNSI